jgi:shikimate 5-dehydrogenase
LGSVNTLYLDNVKEWCGHNTDLEGMKSLLQKASELIPLDNTLLIAVWGGGGTLPLLRELLPLAKLFSAQTGQERQGIDKKDWSPEWVIWAGGLLRSEGTSMPPEHWKPKLVVDLNYREDSGGRELAKHWGCHYVSGEAMFYSQAKHQRLFWRPLLESRWRSRKN